MVKGKSLIGVTLKFLSYRGLLCFLGTLSDPSHKLMVWREYDLCFTLTFEFPQLGAKLGKGTFVGLFPVLAEVVAVYGGWGLLAVQRERLC